MAQTIRVEIDKLGPGMRVAKMVENQLGAVLLTPGMILDENIIMKLQRMGIPEVVIYNETDKEVEENKQKFTEQYIDSIGNFKEVMFDAKRQNNINFASLKKIADNSLQMDTNRDIVSMLSMVRSVDEYTYSHSVNVGILAMMFGRWAGLQEKEIKQLLYAGMLHDIGKAKIPDEILNKRGPLTEQEYNIMKTHTVHGYQLTKTCTLLSENIRQAVLLHHERNDGSGYPFGHKKDKIPFMARVLAIVDTYDAMTSDRVYRDQRPPFEVFALFEEDLPSYDLLLTNVFMNRMAQFYLGEMVELDNGQMGEIVFLNPNQISRPIVKVGDKYIDLADSELNIKKVEIKRPAYLNNIEEAEQEENISS